MILGSGLVFPVGGSEGALGLTDAVTAGPVFDRLFRLEVEYPGRFAYEDETATLAIIGEILSATSANHVHLLAIVVLGGLQNDVLESTEIVRIVKPDHTIQTRPRMLYCQ